MRGHGQPLAGSGGFALTVAKQCKAHADCSNTEFCTPDGCDKCRYCHVGSDSITGRCPCGPGRKQKYRRSTGQSKHRAAPNATALRALHGRAIRLRLAPRQPHQKSAKGKGKAKARRRFKGYIVVAHALAVGQGNIAGGEGGTAAASDSKALQGQPCNSTLASAFGQLESESRPMQCFGDAAVSHATATARREVGMTYFPALGCGEGAGTSLHNSTHDSGAGASDDGVVARAWFGVIVLERCRGSVRRCDWYKFSQTLTLYRNGTALLPPPPPAETADPADRMVGNGGVVQGEAEL